MLCLAVDSLNRGQKLIIKFLIAVSTAYGACFDNIVKAADGMGYYLVSTEKVDAILDMGTELYEVLMLYRDGVQWPDIETNRAEEREEQKQAEESKNAEPEIGMTKSEVLNGAWGAPDKKNIDEYEWGIEEQWVYDGRGYVYFVNGIVTAIQHR